MKISPFKASYPKVELITSPKSFFSNIKHSYREYKENNIYHDLEEDSLFVYEIQNANFSHLGLLSTTEVREMKKKNILKHEKTLAAKEQQMMHLLLQRKALVKPVLLGFHSSPQINKFLKQTTKKQPILDIHFDVEEESHRIWKVSDPKAIKDIVNHFSSIKKAYIGDGHHRSTTIKILSESKELGDEAKKYKMFYTAYFPFKQLKICDYNRMVDISQIMSIPEYIVGLSKYFEITKMEGPAKPKKKHHVTTYIDGNWYKLKWKQKYIDQKKGKVVLDSALINKHIFGSILGIEDVRVDTRIKYYGGTQPLSKIEGAAHKVDAGIGICIYPVTVKELTALADKGQTLPPKSTWFLPRLKSGIITKDL